MKITLYAAAFVVSGIVGLLTMIYGWGLEVKSWGWVIGGWLFGSISAATIQIIGDDYEKAKKD